MLIETDKGYKFSHVQLLYLNIEKPYKSTPVDFIVIDEQMFNGSISSPVSIYIENARKFKLVFVTDDYVLNEIFGPMGFVVHFKGIINFKLF